MLELIKYWHSQVLVIPWLCCCCVLCERLATFSLILHTVLPLCLIIYMQQLNGMDTVDSGKSWGRSLPDSVPWELFQREVLALTVISLFALIR